MLAAIGNQAGKSSNPLTFTATATDADLPLQTLSFSLGIRSAEWGKHRPGHGRIQLDAD